MRFSVNELLLLVVPAAFMSLWIADMNQQSNIEWTNFSLPKLQEAQEKRVPVVIAAYPDRFGQSKSPFGTLLEDRLKPVLQRINSTDFVACRHEYKYWTESPKEWPAITRWLVEHGAGKEPSIIFVAPDGSTVQNHGFSKDAYPVFILELSQRKIHRNRMLLGIFALSFIFSVAIIFSWRNSRFKERGITMC